jgi:hypothetical protein
VQLVRAPESIYSSPDGACLLVQQPSGIIAFHWSTFGSNDGVIIDVPLTGAYPSALTSFGHRGIVHFVILDTASSKLCSIALTITARTTEFSFKQKGAVASRPSAGQNVAQNLMVDCHSEVWTRFPVVPAVRRSTIRSGEQESKAIIFVSPLHHSKFSRYFRDIVSEFEKRTRKPTESELGNIDIFSMTFEDLFEKSRIKLSILRLGEWLVDILCLIPIHIAVTRDNRFIPLKDGVWSVEFERSLAGATVDRIVDELSLGWYESIFQSYMATKVRNAFTCLSLSMSITIYIAMASIAGQGCIFDG